MSKVIRAMLIAWSLLLLFAVPAPAQWARAALGAGVGVAGGTVVTLSAIVARARFQQEYIDSVDDLIHWQTIPMIAAPAAGIVFGLAGRDAQMGSIVGSSSGLVAGAAVGAGLGWLLSTQQEAPWAGGVIGAGVGLTIGGLTGGILAWNWEDEETPADESSALHFGLRIPAP
jgi:hypothetical protein